MAFKRFSVKARKAIRPTGSKATKKAASKKFPFKKFMKNYPSAEYALRRTNAYSYGLKDKIQKWKPRSISYNLNSSYLQNAPQLVDVSKAQVRLTPSKPLVMEDESEPEYQYLAYVGGTPDEPRKAIRLYRATVLSLADIVWMIVERNKAALVDVKDSKYITFEKLSVRLRYYSHPISGAKPYHGYFWEPSSKMTVEEIIAKHEEKKYGKSYNGKGFMSLKFNIASFILKNGGSPFITLTPSIDKAGLMNLLQLAPTLTLYSFFPQEADLGALPPEVGRRKFKLTYRVHNTPLVNS